ncbi:hypothetical protein QBC34DRAFT_67309 [Podospora aff. communis PSN243]|uniref:Uncharacterized protein n=1 Tax=Podospora aff. communis PSN243 TaxID=3040156 RepID=A0AAV9H4N1_9PEZI|nr:hypothetical protein QBC34DRAFT_67309 [Podospora aff. communis PSN243]
MHPVHFLSFLAGTAAAIDIYLHPELHCRGSYSLCTNVPPGICCSVVVRYGSVAFLGIPRNWNLHLTAYKPPNCGPWGWKQDVLGVDHACLFAPGGYTPVSGGIYTFKNKKRDAIEEPFEPMCDANLPLSECQAYQRPNEVGFEDGTKYDLTLMDETAGDELMAIVGNGGTSADVPVSFAFARK